MLHFSQYIFPCSKKEREREKMSRRGKKEAEGMGEINSLFGH